MFGRGWGVRQEGDCTLQEAKHRQSARGMQRHKNEKCSKRQNVERCKRQNVEQCRCACSKSQNVEAECKGTSAATMGDARGVQGDKRSDNGRRKGDKSARGQAQRQWETGPSESREASRTNRAAPKP